MLVKFHLKFLYSVSVSLLELLFDKFFLYLPVFLKIIIIRERWIGILCLHLILSIILFVMCICLSHLLVCLFQIRIPIFICHCKCWFYLLLYGLKELGQKTFILVFLNIEPGKKLFVSLSCLIYPINYLLCKFNFHFHIILSWQIIILVRNKLILTKVLVILL